MDSISTFSVYPSRDFSINSSQWFKQLENCMPQSNTPKESASTYSGYICIVIYLPWRAAVSLCRNYQGALVSLIRVSESKWRFENLSGETLEESALPWLRTPQTTESCAAVDNKGYFVPQLCNMSSSMRIICETDASGLKLPLVLKQSERSHFICRFLCEHQLTWLS